MSVGLDVRPAPPRFARSSSLYLPEPASLSTTQSLLRSSSYSPFPVFPGSTHDPHNLDRFLLPPDDPSFFYADPAPAASTLSLVEKTPMKESSRPLKKVRSMSMLARTSPLSQPPSNADNSKDVLAGRNRRRSNSVDSNATRGSHEDLEDGPAEDLIAIELVKPASRSLGRNTLRKAFSIRRMSMIGLKDMASETPVPPPTRVSSIPLNSRASSFASSEEADPTTPMSTRSNSNNSEASSSASSSSSEGPKTPAELVGAHHMDVELAGGKLAEALAAAGEKQNKKSSWRGWLGGKRSNKAYQSVSPGSKTPSDTTALSTDSSPNASVVSLVNPIPHLKLTPSPSIISSTEASRSSLDRSISRGYVIEQLRRSSYAKLNQLRSPSPHPLAMALRRQYSNLPDEVAISIQAGQKVFPLSVNIHTPEAGLHPSEGGLGTTLGVKWVMTKLDQGDCPEEPLPRAKVSDINVVRRPKGVLDFVNRLPFEERMMVFYPDGVFSPISMARPGNGVWDLDFSNYIFALSKCEEEPVSRSSTAWPILPRPSLGAPMQDIHDVIVSNDADISDPMATFLGEEDTDIGLVSTPDTEESEEVLISPLPTAALLELVDAALIPTQSPPTIVLDLEEMEAAPVSSFAKARVVKQTWDDSSDEESEAEEEESDEEDKAPLAKILARKRSFNALTAVPVPTKPTHARSTSQPGEKRSSVQFAREDDAARRRALEEIAKTRERRNANIAGEAERRAEAEQKQKRLSTVPTLSASTSQKSLASTGPNKRTSTSQIAAPRPPTVHVSQPPEITTRGDAQRDTRRRVKSSYDVSTSTLAPPRPGSTRQKSSPDGMPRRYHSFYEVNTPSVATAPVAPPMPMGMSSMGGMAGLHLMGMYGPGPGQMAPQGMYAHPGMTAFPAMVPGQRSSLVFPQLPAQYAPQFQYGQMVQPPYASASYYQHPSQARQSRVSLSRPQ